MRLARPLFTGLAIACFALSAPNQAAASSIVYSNLQPNGALAAASRPGSVGVSEIEAADDFILTGKTFITSASFIGLVPIGSNVSTLDVEIYRVFPNDSTVPPDTRVPTRANSPSDVAFDSRDSAAGELSFSTSTLSSTFTASNSVKNGINPVPGQLTLGEGPVTGQEVLFTVVFSTPFDLPADHYFFVPQVSLTAGDFYWLSAQRPILPGGGNTPISPDLQAWIRNTNLDPDWLRIGTDIVGGGSQFNMAFALQGDAEVPEPGTLLLVALGVLGLAGRTRRRQN